MPACLIGEITFDLLAHGDSLCPFLNIERILCLCNIQRILWLYHMYRTQDMICTFKMAFQHCSSFIILFQVTLMSGSSSGEESCAVSVGYLGSVSMAISRSCKSSLRKYTCAGLSVQSCSWLKCTAVSTNCPLSSCSYTLYTVLILKSPQSTFHVLLPQGQSIACSTPIHRNTYYE